MARLILLLLANLGGCARTRYLPPARSPGPMDIQVYPIPPDSGPLPAYRAMLAAGELATDESQAAAAERLHALWTELIGYDPKPPAAPSR